MSKKSDSWPHKPWKEKAAASRRRTTTELTLAPVDLSAGEVDTVATLNGKMGFKGGDVQSLAEGALSALAKEEGVVTERGLNRVRSAVKFIAGLMGGMKHKEAMAASGLAWMQVNAFMTVSSEFRQMYQAAKGAMKNAMGMKVLDTAFEMATEGDDVFDKEGNVVGKKKSEKMLDRLLTLSGREFGKDGGGGGSGGGSGGGISLTFHFDGKGRPEAAEVVNVG